MSEINVNPAIENANVNTAAKKKLRRGVNNETRATTLKKFNERDVDHQTGLFKAHIESVEVRDTNIGEEASGMPSFAGMTIPKLIITFASNEANPDDRKYITKQFLPAESNVETIPNGNKAWQVDSVFAYIKHILNVFVFKGREMTEAEETALTLPFEDFDENMEYVSVDPEVVVAGWKYLFTNFAAIMNGTNVENGKPAYKDQAGKFIPIYLKLLRYIKQGGEWKPLVNGKTTVGDLALPSFVGEGVIEIIKKNVMPTIRFNAARESIIYRETAKAPTMPNTPSAPMAGGVPISDVGGAPAGFGGDIYGAPAEDLPF